MSNNSQSDFNEAIEFQYIRNYQSLNQNDMIDVNILVEVSEIMRSNSGNNQLDNFSFVPSRTQNPLTKNIQFIESDHGMNHFYGKLKKKTLSSKKSNGSFSTNSSDC